MSDYFGDSHSGSPARNDEPDGEFDIDLGSCICLYGQNSIKEELKSINLFLDRHSYLFR